MEENIVWPSLENDDKMLTKNYSNSKISKFVYVVTSKKTDSNETILHKYSKSREAAILLMELLALEDLKKYRGLTENDFIVSPLKDTFDVDKIMEGYTIRYKKDNPDVIDLIKIERINVGQLIVFNYKKRSQTCIKSYHIVCVKSI
jgi:hypothetical protein